MVTDETAQLGADPPEDLEPDPPPAAADAPAPAAVTDEPASEPEPEPEGKPYRHTRRPSHNPGWYMVIGSPLAREGFFEIGWFKAGSTDTAKRHAVADAEKGHNPELKAALASTGLFLRAIPAQSWPKTDRTEYDQPPPRLRIG